MQIQKSISTLTTIRNYALAHSTESAPALAFAIDIKVENLRFTVINELKLSTDRTLIFIARFGTTNAITG